MSHGAEHPEPAPIDEALARTVAERMHVLSTPSRVRILGELRRGPSSVGALSDAVGMESSAVSHQLAVLRHMGFVLGERQGRQVVYELHDPHVAELLDQLVFHVEHVRAAARASLEPQLVSSP